MAKNHQLDPNTRAHALDHGLPKSESIRISMCFEGGYYLSHSAFDIAINVLGSRLGINAFALAIIFY
ncbi:hypothetical protein V6238_06600 [Marinomonas arenicola]|uniref:hypothetical protein n=1 Tax=Marinomonas arenicola TaxID=569601 RepID=UPI00311F4263